MAQLSKRDAAGLRRMEAAGMGGIVGIDPRYRFGAPRVKRINISTGAIFDRFLAGESVEALAHDYGCRDDEIEAAIRFEIHRLR